jgi:hypothetical protein
MYAVHLTCKSPKTLPAEARQGHSLCLVSPIPEGMPHSRFYIVENVLI